MRDCRAKTALDLPVACSCAPATVSSGLRLSPAAVSENSPLRLDVSEAVVLGDSRAAASCLLIFFLPLEVPPMPALPVSDSLGALGRDEVEEADGEADALEPLVFFG